MKFIETEIAGVLAVELEPFVDERGSFARIWCAEKLAAQGLTATLAQCSISSNPRAGTIRGLHFQETPHEEAKLVRCIRGAIFDVAVDLRVGSPTRGQWLGRELSSENGHALYVPEGCAHGFQTLVDDTEVLYLISTPYLPAAQAGVRWNDPALGIMWPEAATLTISERDAAWPLLEP